MNTTTNSLDTVVDTTAKLYVISEPAFDAHHFNPDAYQNLLELMGGDAELTGILIDGPLTRLDRPEYLTDEDKENLLSYWSRSDDECLQETEEILNREQYATMMDRQMNILENRLLELKEKVPHTKEIVLSVDSDDLQYTISAMINEAMVRRSAEIEDEISRLKGKRDTYRREFAEAKKEREALESVPDSGAARGGLTQKINDRELKMENTDHQVSELYAEKNLYREKKVRPSHQLFTRRFMEMLYGRYEDLAERVGVTLITKPSVLAFDDLTIEFAHSREVASWSALKTRDLRFRNSIHGRADELQGIDALVEGGHAGIGFKQLQKLYDVPEESNFKNQSRYDPVIGDEFITLVMCLPFEDQEKIVRYTNGEEAVRMSGGKPMGTRNHEVIKRLKNGGVSGLTVITKNQQGVIGTEWIQYKNFSDGSVLRQPEEYAIIAATSDEHIGSPEANPMVQRGMTALYNFLLENPRLFRGKLAYAKGFISGGDTAEANSRKWDHLYHHTRNPHEVAEENIDLLANLDAQDPEALFKLVMKLTSDARGGSVESMDVILNWVADYYDGFLKGTLEHSELKWAHASVTGNHADGVLRDLGIKEFAYFVQRLKGRGIESYEVGIADYFRDNATANARVAVGGYSNARCLHLPDYGKDVDDNVLFGPINLWLQHDPKGGNFSGLIGAGRSVNADVAMAGHTHENWVKIYNTGLNQFSVAYRMTTLQGVTPTEKYYASGLPRTQAGHLLIMPTKGHFYEEALPAPLLREMGKKDIEKRIDKAL